jgi:hypothetical protein
MTAQGRDRRQLTPVLLEVSQHRRPRCSLFSVAVFRLSLTQWPKATRRLDRVRKEDTCPSLLRLIRIRIPPVRSHPLTAPSRPCHIRAPRLLVRSHPLTAPSRPCHRRPTPARINPPRPGDGACVRRRAEPRQALSNGPDHDADGLPGQAGHAVTGGPRDLPQPREEPALIHSSLRSANLPQVLPARL